MKYHIAQHDKEVVISFDEPGAVAQTVIDAIGRCRQSASACASGECMKIGVMEPCREGEVLGVRLRPRADTALSVVSLGECLKYQLPGEMHN